MQITIEFETLDGESVAEAIKAMAEGTGATMVATGKFSTGNGHPEAVVTGSALQLRVFCRKNGYDASAYGLPSKAKAPKK